MRLVLFVQSFICFSLQCGILLCLNGIHGHNYSLECLNDYHYIIRCELNMTSEPQPHDALYWLEFYEEREPFECVLTSQTYPWVCVLNLSIWAEDTFIDTSILQISLNYSFHGDNGSVVLEKTYKPVHHIRPVPPSKLTLLRKPDEVVFNWSSGYNKRVMLVPHLKYQLRIHRNGKVQYIQSTLTSMSVPVSTFVPNTSYVAHVRSAPQQVLYKGVWSHWGPAVHWTTGPSNSTETLGPEAAVPDMTIFTFCLVLFLLPVIFLCYFLYTRWKRCVLDPSPAPHIGEFKCSLMRPEDVSELLQRELSLQIHNLTDDVDSVPEPNPTLYENVSNVNGGSGHASSADCRTSLGVPPSAAGSKDSMNIWMQVSMSAEKASVTYSDGYCTLSEALNERAVNTH